MNGLIEMVRLLQTKPRKSRRPGVIQQKLEPIIVELYQRSYGYRAITRVLREEYGVNPDFSSVRKTLILLGKVIGK